MIKKTILFCILTKACIAVAEPINNETLQLSGRALANYQICAQVAEDLGDKTMHSYYSEMFNDRSIEINQYPQSDSQIVFLEFNKSIIKLANISLPAMTIICSKRFDSLTRKMQEKKLSSK